LPEPEPEAETIAIVISIIDMVQGGIAEEYRAKQNNMDRLRFEAVIEKTSPEI
jgi:hypothetical protein